jgi:cytoskeletal protein CcmA (bactofilin family)
MGQVLYNHFNPAGFNNDVPEVATISNDIIVDVLLVAGAIAATIYILNRIELKPAVRIVRPEYKE